MERMNAMVSTVVAGAALALSAVMAQGAETHTHKSHAHKSILKVEFAERRELHILIDDFVLTDQDGKRVAFREFRGKPVVVNFMYTSCPDVCPLLTASLKILRDHMKPAEARDIRFLSITTDPEVDTPAVLKAYSKRHEADALNWSWLSGEVGELSPVWQGFGVSVKRIAKGLIEHTTLTVVADAQGYMRFAYFGSAPDPDVLLKDLRALETRPST